MDKNKDAFGHMLEAYVTPNGEWDPWDPWEILEREDGLKIYRYDISAYFNRFKYWPEIEKQAIQHARGKVLDIGAGPGRVSLYLQESGYDVTSIDNSPLAIKVCKSRGVRQAEIIPVDEIGGFRFSTFDTVVMYGNNFGLFGSRDKAKDLLRTLYKITNPDALILAGSEDISNFSDLNYVSYSDFNRKRGRLPGQYRIRVIYKQYTGDWFDFMFASHDEMKDILKGTGWKVKIFLDSGDTDYIAVIEKE
jgi:SAM-dependent methyltransferase